MPSRSCYSIKDAPGAGDKERATIAEPRRYRNKDHLRFLAQRWQVSTCPPVAQIWPHAVSSGSSANVVQSFNPKRFRTGRCVVLAALRPGGPYPLLAVSGEQGSAARFRAACAPPHVLLCGSCADGTDGLVPPCRFCRGVQMAR